MKENRPEAGRSAHEIRLVLADVDGTLVTTDKRLTSAACEAVRRLRDRGIAFTVTSSRPPFGLRMLVGPLGLDLPIGAFNGGTLVAADLSILEQHLIPPAAAARGVQFLTERGIDIWLFSGDRWLLRNPAGPYVDHERRTVEAEPVVVSDWRPHLGAAAKIVGVSADFDRLAACERELGQELAGAASVIRSQRYYLDLTPPAVDKGSVVEALTRSLGVPAAAIATIGDMENDLPMFRKSGFSIAMGNAPRAVQDAADAVTSSNDEDGFAAAMERFILRRGGV
ncbi:MAG TPA: HAD family hydrolase [Stellaceae bacterium]|nr:HAD family hydrolase [Stellaceae bacterium]